MLGYGASALATDGPLESSQPTTLLAARPSSPPAAPDTILMVGRVVDTEGMAFRNGFDRPETCMMPVVVVPAAAACENVISTLGDEIGESSNDRRRKERTH